MSKYGFAQTGRTTSKHPNPSNWIRHAGGTFGPRRPTGWVILDKDGYLVYDGPPPYGTPLSFTTQAGAERLMHASNWHLDGMIVGRLVAGELVVAEGTYTPLEWLEGEVRVR